jgi:hypothetical protein
MDKKTNKELQRQLTIERHEHQRTQEINSGDPEVFLLYY